MIEANHPILLGTNNSNLPRIVTIIADAFYNDAISPTNIEGNRMLVIVKQIQSNPEIFQACINGLSVEQKQAIEDAFREAGGGSTGVPSAVESTS